MDLHRSLIHLAVSNGYAESGMENLLLAKNNMPSALPPEDVPSGSWIRGTVEKVPEDAMTQKLKNALNSTVNQLQDFKIFSALIIAGTDTHKIPRHDKNLITAILQGERTRRGHRRSKST